MKRELLEAEARGYEKGRDALAKEYDSGSQIIKTPRHTYVLYEIGEKLSIASYKDGIQEGRHQGVAMEQSRIRKIEWSKLFGVVVAGAFMAHLLFNLIAMIV
jgi:hypothetical protein